MTTTQLILAGTDQRNQRNLFAHARQWAREHRMETGLVEIGVGAALLALGMKSGAIEMGRDLVFGTAQVANASFVGVGSGSLGAFGASLLGKIGIAAGGTAIAIPSILVIGGAALATGSIGYVVTDIANQMLAPELDLASLAGGSSLLLLGLTLIIDGARRLSTDHRVIASAARIRNRVIELADLGLDVTGKLMTSTAAANVAGASVLAASTGGGLLLGSSLAASSVTVLGSAKLGAAALSLGLVSAPVWPVIAAGAGGAALGLGLWAGVRRLTHR